MNQFAPLRSLFLPFHTAPLLIVAIFSLLLLVGVNTLPLGFVMLLIIGSWFFKYAFMLLDHAAEGRPGAPVLTPEHPVIVKSPSMLCARRSDETRLKHTA
jgi:hypothetical protein